MSETWSNGAAETWSYSGAGSLTEVAVTGISGQKYTSTDTLYGSNGKPSSESWSNGTALYQTETWNPDGSVHDVHVYVAGTFDGVAYASYDNAYLAGFRDLETFYDGSGNVVASETFASDGSYSIYLGATQTAQTLAQQKTVHSDGSYDIAYYGIIGQSYTSYDVVYAANGERTSETWSNGMAETWSYSSAGSLTEVAVTGISGQKYTSTDTLYGSNGKPSSESWSNGTALYQTETWNPDGSVHDVHVYVAGTFDGVAYASYDNAYLAGFRDLETFYDGSGNVVASETFASNGSYSIYLGSTQTAQTLTQQKTVDSDGSYDTAYFDVTGLGYSSYENLYTTAGTKAATAEDMTNGSGNLLLYANDLSVSSSSGQVSVTTGSDTFALNPHANETISAASGTGNDTFVLNPNFGRDVLGGFVISGATSDTLQFSVADFSYLSARASSTTDLQALINNNAFAPVGANTTITDSLGDKLTLNGVMAATLETQGKFVFT